MICSVFSASKLANNYRNRKTERFFVSRLEAAINYIHCWQIVFYCPALYYHVMFPNVLFVKLYTLLKIKKKSPNYNSAFSQRESFILFSRNLVKSQSIWSNNLVWIDKIANSLAERFDIPLISRKLRIAIILMQ